MQSEDMFNYNLVIDKLKDISGDIIDKMIKEKLKGPGRDGKSEHIDCVICGGKYVSSVRCLHFRTKKHTKKIEEIKRMVIEGLEGIRDNE